jgi:hypothetical protein
MLRMIDDSYEFTADVLPGRRVPPAPSRIVLRRTKGWRKPPGAVTVARPTRWGNPFRIGADGDRTTTIARYRAALRDGRLDFTVDDVRAELAGRNLACWCPLDEPCHADVLLEVANGWPAS